MFLLCILKCLQATWTHTWGWVARSFLPPLPRRKSSVRWCKSPWGWSHSRRSTRAAAGCHSGPRVMGTGADKRHNMVKCATERAIANQKSETHDAYLSLSMIKIDSRLRIALCCDLLWRCCEATAVDRFFRMLRVIPDPSTTRQPAVNHPFFRKPRPWWSPLGFHTVAPQLSDEACGTLGGPGQGFTGF